MPDLTTKHGIRKIAGAEFVNEDNLHQVWDDIDAAIKIYRDTSVLAADLPSAFLEGVTFAAVTAANGFAVDGVLVITRDTDGRSTQVLIGTDGTERFRYSAGTDAWQAWKQVLTSGLAGDVLSQYVLDAEKGEPLGVAELDAAGLVPTDQMGPTLPAYKGVKLTSAANAFSQNIEQAITWPTEAWDPDGYHTGVGAAIVIPAGLGGRYRITFSWGTTGNNGTQYEVRLYKNGALLATKKGADTQYEPQVIFEETFAQTDSIELRVMNLSASPISLSGSARTWMSVYYMGAA